MTATMRLRIATPSEIEVDTERCVHVRAEDATGSFGIQPHHAAFVTVLVPSVVMWREDTGAEHYVAVRGGVLTVTRDGGVQVVTREAIAGDDLERLQRAVMTRLRADAEAELQERRQTSQLHMNFVRKLSRYLRGDDHPALAARAGETDER